MRKTIRFDRSRVVLGVVVGIVLLLVATAVGAVVPRSAVSGATTSPSSSLNLSRPGGVQAGDVLIAAVSYRLDGSAAVGAPSGWTHVRTDTCAGPRETVQTQRLYYRIATGAEPSSYAWSFGTAAGAVGAVVAYTGVDSSAPIAVHNGDRTRNSAWVRAAAVTSPVANGMVVAALSRSSSVSIPAPNGMNARTTATTAGGPSAGMLIADVVQPSAGDTGNKPAKTSEITSCNIGQLFVLRSGNGPVTPPPAPVVVKPANTGTPVLTGTPVAGGTVSVTNGVWSGTFPMTYSYRWERCTATCTTVGGATERTYSPTAGDVSSTLRATVVATNDAGNAVATTAPSAEVTAPVVVVTQPGSTGVPAVSGTPQAGSTLQASSGAWSGTTPMTYTQQWSRCEVGGAGCVAIAGATTSSYVPVAVDVGTTLRVSVRATNSAGSDSATSAATAVVVAEPTGGGGGTGGSGGSSGNQVILTNASWECDGPVDLDLVKVTSPPGDAIVLGSGCSGRIGRIEVDTWTQDGVKVQNQQNPARNVVIGGGYVKCHAMAAGAHQDAVQAMGGSNIRFNGVSFDCLGNSNFFIAQGGSGASTPTDVVCSGCFFGRESGQSVFLATSLRASVIDSTVCHGRFDAFRYSGAIDSVVSGNTELAHNDPRCVAGV